MGRLSSSWWGPATKREAILFYSSLDREIPVARLLCRRDEIEFELLGESSTIPLGRRELEEAIRFLVDLPVRLFRMRHKTMPHLFNEVAPGSEDHFALIERSYGPFKITSKGLVN